MKIKKSFLLLLLWLPFTTTAQTTDTLLQKLDSLYNKRDSIGPKQNNINQIAYNENTKITFKSYFILQGSNVKQQFTAPFRMKKRHLPALGIFTLSIGGLTFADKPIQRVALGIRERNPVVRNISGYVTNFGAAYEIYTLAAIGAYGLVFKKEKIKTTTLLATQSFITASLIKRTVKFLTGRQRPLHLDPTTGETVSTFHGPFYNRLRDDKGNRLNNAFPSGHTTAAFAAATVFALEYKDRPLIPIISYTAASLIGISRLTENKHWFTDVLAGAALGFLSGRQVVNNYHRYARLKAPGKRKNFLSFNLQYTQRQLQPGLVYHIK